MKCHIYDKITKIIGEIESVEVMEEQGCTSEVSRIVTCGKTYLLKSAFEEKYRSWLKIEAQILETLKDESSIPVPNFFGFCEELDSSHLIMSFEEGVTLTSALRSAASLSEKRGLIRSYGKFLHRFHEQELLQILESNEDWLERQFILAKTYLEKGQADGSKELLENIMSHRPSPVQQTMIHGDCTTDNVLVVDGEVRMLIDVSGMAVGDPRYDEALAIRKFIDHPECIQAFYEGYTRYKLSKEEFEYFNEGLYEFF